MKPSQLTIRIFGVSMDLGQARRGVDMGPSVLRYAGLAEALRTLGHDVIDCGNIATPLAEQVEPGPPQARHLHAVAAVCADIFAAAHEAQASGDVLIFLGGDHSLSIGTVAAVSAAAEKIGVIWVDAHGDFNTPETTPSGNIHGMSLAALLGRGASELVNIGRPGAKLVANQTVLIGTRDLDERERTALRGAGVHVFTMHDIDEHGIAHVTREALHALHGCDRIHVSLDLDAIDPSEAPGVGTPVPGGLTYREAHLLMELLQRTGRIHSLDIVEVNPILDERNRTARLAVELTASLFGKKIL